MPGPQPSRRRTTPSPAPRPRSKATNTTPTDPAPRFRFIGGKGGVGKTTCAASIAVASAKQGTPTLLISTDPAPSLGDALRYPLSSSPRRVPINGGTLYAAEIDAAKSLKRWLAGRRDALERIALRGTWLDEQDVSKLLRLSMPGIDELAALVEIARAGKDARFASIVVDMAPTGHTLRMLDMPETLRAIALVFDRMQVKHRVMVEALTGGYVRDDSDRLIAEIDREARELSTLLRDPGVARMSWVSLPEPMSVEETIAAARALARSGIPLAELIVNRVTPKPSTRCRCCDARRATEHQSITRLMDRLPRVRAVQVVCRQREPRGLTTLNEIGREIAKGTTPDPTFRRTRAASWHARLVASAPRLERGLAAPQARLLLFGGKGGVGKTTCAAAAALALASRTDRPVLLLSTDPANSLSDVLGQPIGSTPRSIRGGPACLRVRAIDGAREFEKMRARYARGIDALFDRLARAGSGSIRVDASHDRGVMHGLIDLAPPGIDELAAIIEVVELIESDPAKTIVLDTAPTGHALRLLEMPALVHEWTKALMEILLKYQPMGGIEEFGPVLVRLSRGLARLRTLVTDPDKTSFVVVTRAAALPREETRDLMCHLGRLNIDVRALMVNAVGRGACGHCRAEASEEARHILGMKREIRRDVALVLTPAELPPPRGPVALHRWQRAWTRGR